MGLVSSLELGQDVVLNNKIHNLKTTQINQITISENSTILTGILSSMRIRGLAFENNSINIFQITFQDPLIRYENGTIISSNVTSISLNVPYEQYIEIISEKIIDTVDKIDKILNIFPNPEDLNDLEKIGFIFLTMLAVTLILFFLGMKDGEISNAMLYIIGGINLFLLIFFIVIGYANFPIVTVTVILIGIVYLRIMMGSRE